MRLSSLGVANLRNIVELNLDLGPGFNAFVGPNGGGKTSILEGAYLLSHAQSFRAGTLDTVIRRGAERLALQGDIERTAGPVRLRLIRQPKDWEARINANPASTLGDFLAEFALVCLDPGSHALISGGSRERRRFLDWGVFHVEPSYLGRVRQYNRALRQRNAILKQNPSSAELDVWDDALSQAAQPLLEHRQRYLSAFARELGATLEVFLPELGAATFRQAQGWPNELSLIEALRQTRTLDQVRGHTARGPHRADWSISFERAPQREQLSRGQEKLCALACVLAQARLYAVERGEWPVIALDDLASELDRDHQRTVIELTAAVGAQVLITGIELPEALREKASELRMFHVEHGNVTSLL